MTDKTDIVERLEHVRNKIEPFYAWEVKAGIDEIERLRAMLRDRDGGVHDEDCRMSMNYLKRPCRCGHEEVAEYFAALNGKED